MRMTDVQCARGKAHAARAEAVHSVMLPRQASTEVSPHVPAQFDGA